jgi:dTDP-4-dehydrorhamnose 3,5-epimerase-like enzyme
MTKVQISELTNIGDARGFSFSLPPEEIAFLGGLADMHLASTGSGAVRGNHYHLRKREAIVVLPGSPWSFHWDEGEGTSPQHRSFPGTGAILIRISPGASHAVRNDGNGTLWLVGNSSEPYDPSETVARKVI